MEPEERYARQRALKEALGYLESAKREKGEGYAHAYDDLIDRYEHRTAEVSGEDGEHAASKADVYHELVLAARGAIEAERRAIIRLRDEGMISDDVQRKIERELDLEATKFDIKS
jgi:hypothetical protein